MKDTTTIAWLKGLKAEKEKRAHGSPFDRGGADYYYSRGRNPHYYPNGTYNEPRIELKDMSEDQVNEYNEGYDEAQKLGFKKEY